jgi:glycine betaine/choline ABC-type transport system substrate-binding protein
MMMSMRTHRTAARTSVPRDRVAMSIVTLAIVLAACGGADDGAADPAPGSGSTPPATSPQPEVTDGPTIVTRGQDFSEARTIAKVYALYLEGLGYPVQVLTAAGFRTEAIAALEAGELGLIVDYIGGSLTALAPDAASSADADEIMAVIRPAYAQLGARVLQYSPAIDGDALIVRGDYAAVTISDLAGLDAILGAAAQCYERPQCYLGLTDPDIYGITFGSTRTIEFGPLLGEALRAGEVDAVIWNDTAPQIGVEGFRVLVDDRGLFPAQNIAPILSEQLISSYGDELIVAIDALSSRISTDDLVAWNVETDLEFREPVDVAREWLLAQGLLG